MIASPKTTQNFDTKVLAGSPQNVKNYDKGHLLELISSYEAELQAKEIAVAVLKAEKARSILRGAKCLTPKSSTNDPRIALLRDSVVTLSRNEDGLAQEFCRSQLSQLDQFVKVQKKCNRKAKQALITMEKRHIKILDQINAEKESMSNPREDFDRQLKVKDDQIAKLEDELGKCVDTLTSEGKRQKIIVLYLINERKQLLLELHELKTRAISSENPSGESPQTMGLKREVLSLSAEKEKLQTTVNRLEMEKNEMHRRMKQLENDLSGIRNKATRQQSETPTTRNDEKDSLIMANRGAFMATDKIPFNVPSSASFPQPVNVIRQSERIASYNHSKPQIISSARRHADIPRSQPNNFPVNNSNNVSNHSTVILHRPPGQSRPSMMPSLGIKASNLPISRNPPPHLGLYRHTRKSTTEPNVVVETVGQPVIVDANSNFKGLITKRSSSLPRNVAPIISNIYTSTGQHPYYVPIEHQNHIVVEGGPAPLHTHEAVISRTNNNIGDVGSNAAHRDKRRHFAS
ncbi:cortactin-binding protein-2 domain-containing protein [Ditylenchus destructor]|nr:cortactin-binding protein-2 domain-containing protein [Ditylenchus destructor]